MALRCSLSIRPSPETPGRHHSGQQPPTDTQHPRAFSHCPFHVCHEAQRKCHQNAIEGLRREGKLLGSPLNGADAAFRGNRQHAGRWIDAGVNTQCLRKATGANSHLQPLTLRLAQQQAQALEFRGEDGLPFGSLVPAVVFLGYEVERSCHLIRAKARRIFR